MSAKTWNILVTGGAGYVGSALVPALLAAGHGVTVLDLYLYGTDVLDSVRGHPRLREVKGDLRDPETVRDALTGCDAVIHLACISNDPSFELDPDLGRSINFDAFRPLVKMSKDAGVSRFIYASSSSVYGVKNVPTVTEEMTLEPLTDYSKFKAMCEDVLREEQERGFVATTVRPATVCGYAPRQRLDVIVNILTNHAVNNGAIRVFGGTQKRPNVHVLDMVNSYLMLLRQPGEAIDQAIYNVGDENFTVNELAEIVRKEVGGDIAVRVEPTNDNRSYHISSDKILKDLGWKPQRSIAEAVRDLTAALRAGRLPDSMNNSLYYNIKRMQDIQMS